MICVTGAERTIEALAARVARFDGALHEVRADHLAHLDDDLFALVEREGERLLFCCRAPSQGGAFCGTEAERLSVLHRASAARWIDVEHDVPLDGFDPARVVLSWHDFESPAHIVSRAHELAARRVGVVKLAVKLDDAADIATLRKARQHIDGPAIVIGMGPAGLLTRARYAAMGSLWTYVAADRELATAPGQLDWEGAVAMGLPDTASAPFCALVGGPQVFASPGTRVYNALYRTLSLSLSYVPVVTQSLARSLPVLESLGAVGLSATMPLKDEALRLCTPDELAASIGSVNSLRRGKDGAWEGTNTDVEGVRAPLEAAGVGGRALVLGAGGAARAAAAACRELGMHVTLCARSTRGQSDVQPWARRADLAHDVLINATPLSGEQSPWPSDAPLARCVFDLAIASHSALLERGRREGSTVITAQQMWLHQGARQMSWTLGRSLNAAQLEEHL